MGIIKQRGTYRRLEDMLFKTGFHIAGRKGTNNIYAHKSLDSIIILPNRNRMEAVRGTYVTAIKRALVDNGLMEIDEFEKEINAPVARLNVAHRLLSGVTAHRARLHRQREANKMAK